MKKVYIWFCLILSISACRSSDSIFKKASELASQKQYCEAIQELTEIKIKSKDEPQKIETLINSVNDFGVRCIQIDMEQARQIGTQAKTLQEFEMAYAKCNNAKYKAQTYINTFKSKLGNKSANFQIWQSADEAFLLDMYEQITEVKYKNALKTYEAGNLEDAYNQFSEVLKRQADYKDAEDYIRVIRETLAENYYQQGVKLSQSETNNNYREAYSKFDKALQWVPNYKDAVAQRQFCYDKITEMYYQEAMQLRNAVKYRKAWQTLKIVSERSGSYAKYPRIQQEMDECAQAGKIKIYVEVEDQELNNLLYNHIQTKVKDDFLELVDNYSNPNYRISASIRYQVSEPTPQKTRRTAYLIRSYEYDQRIDSNTVNKVRKFYAEEVVYYYQVNANKSITCSATYSIRGNSRLLPNRTPSTYTGKSEDVLEYYDAPGSYSLADLTTQIIKYDPKTNINTKPEISSTWLKKFEESRAFRSEAEMKEDAKKKVADDLIQAIVNDIQAMLNKIE